MTTRNGADLLCELLADHDVGCVFGNPGTTELPLVDALDRHSDLRFVLGLQEATVIGMADGYGRVRGRPAFASVHANAGLGNAMGGLTNAMAHHAPMVVTAGNADRRHSVRDPLLSGDLVGLAAGAVKSGTQVERVADLGVTIRRAFLEANAPAPGPVFVSLPSDVLESDAPDNGRPPMSVVAPTRAGGVDEAARLLVEANGDVAIVAGDAVPEADALTQLVEIAELLGAPVFGAPFHARRVFPTTHPLWSGSLDARADAIRATLGRFRRVLLVDHQAFLVYPYSEGDPLAAATELIHLAPEHGPVGRTHAVRLGLVGDVHPALEELAVAIRPAASESEATEALREGGLQAAVRAEKLETTLAARRGASPMHPMVACAALLAALPPESIVVDEAVSTGAYLRGLHRTTGRNTYWFCRGGGLGWGMPAGVGLSLGSGGEPILVVVGDGSAMYAPQAMWTAAREQLPVVFAVVDNGEYAILKQNLRAHGSSSNVGMDLDRPSIDFVALAESMGVPAARVDQPDDVTERLAEAWGRGPSLLHLPIAASRK